jgi:MFS family permease
MAFATVSAMLIRRDRPYYGWILVVGLGVITIVVYGTVQYFFGVLVVPVGRELGWSRTELSLGYSISLALAGLLGLPLGRWIDRRGARGVLVLGSLFGGLSLIALSRVDALWQWEVLWGGGLGLAGAMTLYPITMAVVANWFHRRRGTAMATLTVLGGLASPIFIPLAGWLVPHAGWRQTLVLFGLAQLVIALPLALVLVRRHPEDVGLFPDGAPSADRTASHPEMGVGLRTAVGLPAFWTLTVAAFVGLGGSNILFAHQVAYMIGTGQPPAVAASLAGAVGLASLPGRLVLNLLSDRLPAQVLLAATQCVLALGVGALALGSLVGLIAYVVIFGAGFGSSAPLIALVRAEHFGRRAFARIGAVQGIAALGGAALGPLVAGWTYDRTGSYLPALLAVAALYVVSAATMFFTPRPVRFSAPPPREGT